MQYRNFEDFIQEKLTEQHPEILDDDLPDFYADYEWDTDELIKYADMYARVVTEKLIEEIPTEVEERGNGYHITADLAPLKQQLRAKWLKE